MGRRIVAGGLVDSAGFRSVHSHRWAAANAPDKMLRIPRIVLGFIGWQTCGRHPAIRQSWLRPGRLRLRRGSPLTEVAGLLGLAIEADRDVMDLAPDLPVPYMRVTAALAARDLLCGGLTSSRGSRASGNDVPSRECGKELLLAFRWCDLLVHPAQAARRRAGRSLGATCTPVARRKPASPVPWEPVPSTAGRVTGPQLASPPPEAAILYPGVERRFYLRADVRVVSREQAEGMTEFDAVTVRGLRKRYGSGVVVDQLDFDVSRGEMVGVAGADGTGKTITVECIQGLRRPGEGALCVLGCAPVSGAAQVGPLIGGRLRDSALPERTS